MLFTRDILDAIVEGRVDLAFRRWRRPTVKAGGRLHTAVGVLAIADVGTVDPDALTAEDALRAGHADLAELRRDLDRRPEGQVHRIGVRFEGDDPRIALRAEVPGDLAVLVRKLEAMDRRHGAPWTGPTLSLIAERPGARAGDLAAALGEPEPAAFKARVRRLKALGLTESLEVGYRLSPRGVATLAALAPSRPPP